MRKLDQFNEGIENIDGKGDDILTKSEEKAEQAGDFRSRLDMVDVVDEDGQAILNEAREQGKELAQNDKENVLLNPMEEVHTSLDEVSREANEDAERERRNAENLRGAAGDYNAVGGTAEGAFEQHAQEFTQVSEEAKAFNDSYRERAAALAARLDEMF